MANKQSKTLRNGKGLLTEQPEQQKHVQPAKGWPMHEQQRMEMLTECLLSNLKLGNI